MRKLFNGDHEEIIDIDKLFAIIEDIKRQFLKDIHDSNKTPLSA